MTSTAERLDTTVEGDRVVADAAGDGDEAVLCIHGLLSQRASLGPLVEVLAERGYRAIAPDLRGHGDSEGMRGRVSQRRAMSDLRAWAELVEEQDASVVGLVGHSLGGLWALAAQPEIGAEVVAAVASPVSIRHELSALERGFYRVGATVDGLVRPLGIDLRVPYQVDLEDVLETEEAIETARRVDLVQAWIPLANAEDLLALDGARLAAAVDAPAIVAQATRDRLVAETSTRQLYEALAPPKRFLQLAGPHECFFDVDGRQAAQTLVEALGEAREGGLHEGDEPDDREEQ